MNARAGTACARRRSRAPDVPSPAFEAEAHRQSLAVAQSRHESEDQAFIDALADGNPNEARRSQEPECSLARPDPGSHKLLVTLNAMLTDRQPWRQPQPA